MGFYFCNRNFKLCKILMSHREKEGGRNLSLVLVGNSSFPFFNALCKSQSSQLIRRIENGFDMIVLFYFIQEVGWQHSNCSERTDQRGSGWQAGTCASSQAKPAVLILWCCIEGCFGGQKPALIMRGVFLLPFALLTSWGAHGAAVLTCFLIALQREANEKSIS